MTIQEIAQQAYDCFETAERHSPRSTSEQPEYDTYVRLKDPHPDNWLYGLVRDAHGDMFPNDWRYKTIRSALGFIADMDEDDNPEDLDLEFADQEVDTYTSGRIEWLGSHSMRIAYCDEAVEDLGLQDSILEMIGMGQMREAEEIYHSVLVSLQRRLDWLNSEEE